MTRLVCGLHVEALQRHLFGKRQLSFQNAQEVTLHFKYERSAFGSKSTLFSKSVDKEC